MSYIKKISIFLYINNFHDSHLYFREEEEEEERRAAAAARESVLLDPEEEYCQPTHDPFPPLKDISDESYIDRIQVN